MVLPKGTPIVVYNGTIFSTTKSLSADELHLSKTTHDIPLAVLDIDGRLSGDLRNQLTAVCLIHGIGSIGTIDLLVHTYISGSKPWYLFTSKTYLK